MKKFVSIVLLLTVLAYVVFKGVVWYQTSRALDQAQSGVHNKGVLKWDSIGSSIAGQVSVYDLSYQYFSLTQPLEVSRATFATGSPSSLLESLTGNTVPHQWQLVLTDMKMALEKRLTRDWLAPATVSAGGRWFAMPCSDGQVSLADLVGMGVDQLAADMTITQSRSLDSHGGLRAELDAGRLGSLDVKLPGLMASSLLPPAEQWNEYGGPVDVVLRDGGFMRRFAAYCAQQSGKTVDIWAQHALEAVVQTLEHSGYRMSRQLKALYKVWLRDGGELRASLSAGEPLLGLPVRDQIASAARPVDSVEQFEVFYNGSRVPDLFLSALPVAEKVAEPVASRAQPGSNENRGPNENPGPAYHSATLAEASRWLGREVRVTLVNDRVVNGRFSDLDGRHLEVTRLVDGGELAYPLARKAIRRLEVWRRASDTGREPVSETAPVNTANGATASGIETSFERPDLPNAAPEPAADERKPSAKEDKP
jgi:hypothetical protein